MKILKIIVDEIPNEKEYCKFCTVTEQERFCSITEQKCGSRCFLLATSADLSKEIGKGTLELLKPIIEDMKKAIAEYEVLKQFSTNNEKEKSE